MPVKPVAPPKVKHVGWVRNPVDAFVLAKLEKKGLRPAPEADRRTLLRRVTFDLIGLPPTPAEIDAFLADKSSDAYEKQVDRLLASPRYGERWGRHWLDVARYADSYDVRDIGTRRDINDAWRYRDWVIDALNRDLPYDQFLIHQIAGDLLPAPVPGDINIPGTVATGFLALGNWGNGDADKLKTLSDIVDDQIDAVSRAFMGLTVACARCHAHKFDPISQEDYYGLAGIFYSARILPRFAPNDTYETPLRIPLLTRAEIASRDAHARKRDELQTRLRDTSEPRLRAFARSLLPDTARYLVALREYSRLPDGADKPSLEAFAQNRGLRPYALRQWRDHFALGDYRPLKVPVRDAHDVVSLHQWKGEAPTPWLMVNTNPAARTVATSEIPKQTTAVHPGPDGIVIAWRSPFTGRVRLRGRIADADSGRSAGVNWMVDLRNGGGARELAWGILIDGEAQELANGSGGDGLESIKVKVGDVLQLLVTPRDVSPHTTTLVALQLEEVGGERAWNLTRDLIDDVLMDGKGNPHPDLYGNAAVWRFADRARSRRTAVPGEDEPPAWVSWRRTFADPDATAAALERAAVLFQNAYDAADTSSPFWIHDRADWNELPEKERGEVLIAAAALDAHDRAAPPPVPYAHGVLEGGVPGSGHERVGDVRVHVRGRYDQLGELVPRRFPAVLAGPHQTPLPAKQSGRLELARWLASSQHPLTARVAVNRAWQGHFGRGLVATSSNLGKLGELPTHPQLLDWLAGRFAAPVEKGGLGWSLKGLHRLIVTSAAYRQSSSADPRTLAADPGNRLWGRMDRRRLEWEALRDALPAVSGNLEEKKGGPGERDAGTKRRAVYLFSVRSDQGGAGALFDAADCTRSVETRTAATSAPQALWLLNGPFALALADAFAERLLQSEPADEAARVRRAYLTLYARPPTSQESAIGAKLLADLRAQTGAAPEKDAARWAWAAYAQVLMSANEFLYVD